MKQFDAPYWVSRDQLPGLDFNRQIVDAGSRDEVPEGAVAIYVDDDFWCVALLPPAPYGSMSIQEIVSEIWPTYADQATYAPDHGSPEQRVYFERIAAENQAVRAAHVEEELAHLRAENARLKEGRTDILPRRMTRFEFSSGYFIRQYEHLLVAMAHENQPRTDLPGICSICGLYGSDRVHQQEWIERHRAGYAPDMPWVGQYGNDRSLDMD